AHHPSVVVLEGGTHVPFSPVFHYLEKVFLPILCRMGGKVSATLDRWGGIREVGASAPFALPPVRGLRLCIFHIAAGCVISP
ncbi:MAG: RNA 3'-terminal phosphate cyclase, partial [Proteobacteria bacterium]|nr:RNA 3'-terminal phosphate cyclase [Pseudomonadota bacterium]